MSGAGGGRRSDDGAPPPSPRHPPSLLLEAYVDTLETACAAVDCGAGRLELCGPGEGGLTPSRALIGAVRAALTAEGTRAIAVPIHVMIRPREGDFRYSDAEFAEMRDGVLMAREAGAEGVVCGILRADGSLDVERMRTLVDLARPMRVACHRAFDRTPDADAALDQLIALGVDLVLTSGHAATALEGTGTLARHVRRAAGRIVILAGGGVRAGNVRRILDETGVQEVHARASDPQVFAALVRASTTP